MTNPLFWLAVFVATLFFLSIISLSLYTDQERAWTPVRKVLANGKTDGVYECHTRDPADACAWFPTQGPNECRLIGRDWAVGERHHISWFNNDPENCTPAAAFAATDALFALFICFFPAFLFLIFIFAKDRLSRDKEDDTARAPDDRAWTDARPQRRGALLATQHPFGRIHPTRDALSLSRLGTPLHGQVGP